MFLLDDDIFFLEDAPAENEDFQMEDTTGEVDNAMGDDTSNTEENNNDLTDDSEDNSNEDFQMEDTGDDTAMDDTGGDTAGTDSGTDDYSDDTSGSDNPEESQEETKKYILLQRYKELYGLVKKLVTNIEMYCETRKVENYDEIMSIFNDFKDIEEKIIFTMVNKYEEFPYEKLLKLYFYFQDSVMNLSDMAEKYLSNNTNSN